MNQAGASYESSLLLTLEEISMLVAHSHDPSETLFNIVRLIQGRFKTAVCSVYVLDAIKGELVLSATVGLKSESVGRVRMHINEGLTGLTAEKMAPVMVPDAFTHPRFKYFPESGEDPYHSFLGVPLVEGGELQGVLVVQTMEQRNFSQNEVRMLVTVAAQVASVVGDAHLLELASSAANEPPAAPPPPAEEDASSVLRGTALSPGVGVGDAYVAGDFDEWRQTVPRKSADAEGERRRLNAALEEAREEIVRLSQRISELVGEDHGAILHAQLMILQDRSIERDVDGYINAGATAEAALLDTLDKYVAAFQKLSTPFFQERVYDIKDVFYRVLWRLRPREKMDGGGERQVLVSREASVMELFAADLEHLAAVIVEHGGPQSHAAILARSLGVPMVGQVAGFARLLRPGRRLRVDGTTGEVTLDPPSETIAAVAAAPETSAPVATPMGLPRVDVNLNLLAEAGPALAMGVGGVGLYRSEFLFLARRTLPTEDEQVRIYRKLLRRLDGRPVTIRTFDLRPDKVAAYGRLGTAAARSYDWRLVLESLPLRQLFHEQVRAILRAAAHGPVRILIPLVTRSEIVDYVMETEQSARDELTSEGLEFAADVPFGLMIETAAAAPMVADWAPQTRFFAVGTNDLTASALGLNRDDPASASQIDPLHPGLLRVLDGVVAAARAADRPVSVCGEMAADPFGSIALAALGVDSLSVPVTQWLAIRQAVFAVNPIKMVGVRADILCRRTSAEVRKMLVEWQRDGAGN